MGRNVADTALQLQAISGFHPADPLSYPLPQQHFWPINKIDLSSLKVTFTEDFGVCAVDPMIRQVFRQRVQKIAHEVASCEASTLKLTHADRVFDILRAEAFYAAFAEVYARDPESLGANARINVEMAANIKLADRAWAHLEQTRISRQITEVLTHSDVLIAPTTPLSPFPWQQPYAKEIDGVAMQNYYQWLGLTYVVTLGTHPCISIPCGRDHAGMPFGLQLITRLRDDARLLSIAAAFEALFETRPVPDEALLAQAVPALKSLVTHAPLLAGQTHAGHATQATQATLSNAV
jgi:Asp-tRNA(Asn)/Glu-tRNA(Gln) amidotransferase A subunit family amidase